MTKIKHIDVDMLHFTSSIPSSGKIGYVVVVVLLFLKLPNLFLHIQPNPDTHFNSKSLNCNSYGRVVISNDDEDLPNENCQKLHEIVNRYIIIISGTIKSRHYTQLHIRSRHIYSYLMLKEI